jgi:prephenate dehydrogenase (NADP+)
MEGYKQHFDQVKSFFSERLDQGREQSAELIRKLQME